MEKAVRVEKAEKVDADAAEAAPAEVAVPNLGRPPKAITLAELEKLSALQCTDEELAAYFEVSVRTIERKRKQKSIGEVMQRGRAKGRLSLRRSQFRLAEAGDRTMLIWLGKQLLGQTDKIISEQSGINGGPIEVIDARAKLADLITRRVAVPAASDDPRQTNG